MLISQLYETSCVRTESTMAPASVLKLSRKIAWLGDVAVGSEMDVENCRSKKQFERRVCWRGRAERK